MLLVAPQAQAATRQVGIDIPVQWYADASGQMTIDRFAALPTDQLATTRQIPSFGYSRKTWWLRSELPGTWFAGEPRWLQLGPSFVDHLTIYYRPLGSDAPWAQRTFGDRDGARESDLHYRESVLILDQEELVGGARLATLDRLEAFLGIRLPAEAREREVHTNRGSVRKPHHRFDNPAMPLRLLRQLSPRLFRAIANRAGPPALKEKPSASPEAERAFLTRLEDDIAAFEKIVGRDLSHWREI